MQYASAEKAYTDLDDEEMESVTTFVLASLIEDARVTLEELIMENMLLEKYLLTFGVKKKFQAAEGFKELEQTKIVETKESITALVSKFTPLSDPETLRENIQASPELSESVSIMTSLTEDSLGTKMRKDVFLPIEEKCEIAVGQIKELTDKLTKLHSNWFQKISPFKVKMEEIQLHKRELDQDKNDFEREATINPVTGKVQLERVEIYFSRSIKFKEIQIERSRLEFCFLKSLEKKLEREWKQNDEMGSSLGEIKYNELKIENAQYLEKVEEKNQVMLSVKRHMNITLQVLRQYKLKLQQLMEQQESLEERIQNQKDNIENIEKEIEISANVKNKMEKDLRQMQYQLDNYRVPDVIDYVNTQAEVYELNKLINVWQRRVAIAKHLYSAKFKLLRRGRKRQRLEDNEAYY